MQKLMVSSGLGGGVYSPTKLYRHVQHQSGVVFESFEIGINFNHFGVRI